LASEGGREGGNILETEPWGGKLVEGAYKSALEIGGNTLDVKSCLKRWESRIKALKGKKKVLIRRGGVGREVGTQEGGEGG